jgi:hypothetical protein
VTDVEQDFPEQHDDDVPTKRAPVTARRVVIAGARVVAGAVGIGVAVVTIAASALVQWPTVSSVPPSLVVVPVPTAQQLVCSGGLLRLADDIGQGATTSSAIGAPGIRYSSSSGSVDVTYLEQSDASTGGTTSAPAVISTPPNSADVAEQILLSGAQAQSTAEGDFVGLAASACSAVSGDTWLAGGSTTVGRTTLVTLSNPTEVAATVDLQLFGEDGEITAPGTSGIVVAPSGQRVLSLAGFQPDIESPVIHVTSTGGQIVAELQQATVRGLEPGGVDIVGATGAPSTENIIPGLLVTNSVAVQELQVGGPSFQDLRTVLRLFAPGTGPVQTTISVVPEDGVGAGTSFALEIVAGRVVDVPIEELEDGSYTVRIESDLPVVAAARVSSALESVSDFAWLTAVPELTGDVLVTIAPGPNPVMHLANASSGAIDVVLEASIGPDIAVSIAAGATATVAVEPATSYSLRAVERLFVAVTLEGDGLIARYAAHPTGSGSTAVVVYP